MKVAVWWSAGVTSAIAAHLAIKKYGAENVDIWFFETGAHHKDNERFIRECEQWYGKHISIVQNRLYKNPIDVMTKLNYIKSAYYAPCTDVLKKEMRLYVEEHYSYDHQIFGFEFGDIKELNRAIRFKEQNAYTNPLFPLIDEKISKPQALWILENSAQIKRPMMYQLGFSNNNCKMCPKGGFAYFNLCRKLFKPFFDATAKLERIVGYTCATTKLYSITPKFLFKYVRKAKNIKPFPKRGVEKSVWISAKLLPRPKRERLKGRKKVWLDELDPNRGRNMKPITAECGVICATEFTEFIDERAEKLLSGQMKMEDIW